jgi:predicted Zn finger-like uncharacterized protein
MLIVCPNCKKRFDIDPGTLRDAKRLRCSSCRAVFRLLRKEEAAPPAKPSGRHKVVIANESVAFCEAVQKVLAAEPFEIFVCNDGKVALDTVERVRPNVLLLDVALPTMFGFEVCERVRQNPALAGVKIVLIASIYDKTRYKRSPNSLYGADDYIEKHHIPDSLVPMIYRLASGEASVPQVATPSASELAAQEETRCEIRQVEVSETSSVPEPSPQIVAALAGAPAPAPERLAVPAAVAAQAVEQKPAPSGSPATPAPAELGETELKARRLARIIVSDIVLYNQAKVEQGLRDGTFYDLLADDIREGESLYRQRVSQEVRESTSFLKDAFDDLIAKKRAELRI